MLTAAHKNLHFRIVPDYPEVGVYLYVFDGERCIRDDLQNDVNVSKEIALEDYGVPLTEWVNMRDCTSNDDLKK